MNTEILRAVFYKWNIWPLVDLFTSRTNHKMKTYFTWNYDHQAECQDSFNRQWDCMGPLYAFPPPILIERILQKAESEGVQSLALVAPVWTSASWWPGLLQMADRPPVILPCTHSLCNDPGGNPAFHTRYHLAVWHLSSNRPVLGRCRGAWSPQRSDENTRRDIREATTVRSTSFYAGCSPPSILLSSIRARFLQL